MEPVRSTSAAARRDQGGRWDVTAAESSGPQVVAQTAAEVGAPAARSRFGAYLGLTKPRIIELLLVTTVPTMFLAAGGFPPVWTMVATLVGGALAAGGANTLNSYIDRDIDAKMVRTGRRPLVTGEVSPRNALVFGWVRTVQLQLEQQQNELSERNGELQRILAQVKELRGLLPICSSCKSIRDDQGYWTKLEAYLAQNANVQLSHGMCPSCASKFYPDLYPLAHPPESGDLSA